MNAPSMFAKVASLTLAGICFIIIGGCQQPEEKILDAKEKVGEANQDLKEARREARAEWQEEWLAFKRDNDKAIAENERDILDLRAEVAKVDMRYRDKYTTRIDEIERRNERLRARVNDYKDEGDERWAEFKKDVKREWDDMDIAFKGITVKNN